MTRRSTRRSTRRPFVALLAANAISLAGNAMTLLAVPWFVLSTTGSATRTGLTAFCEGVAFAASAAIGGLAVDRLGARWASIGSDLLSGVAILAIPVLHLAHALPFWLLLVLVSLASLTRAPGETARTVLVPGLIARAGIPLERATSAYDGVSRGARMIGAPLAGVLAATVGPINVLFIDAATFVISAVAVWSAVRQTTRARVARRGQALSDLREGLAFIRSEPLVRAIVIMVMVTNMLDAATSAVLLPVYAREVLGSAVGLGLMVGVFGAGALAGTVAYAALGPRLPRRVVFTAAFLIVGAPKYLGLAVEPPLAIVLVIMALTGFAAGSLNPILGAVDYERVPVALQGRVFGAITAGVYCAMPLGAFGAGWLVALFGLRSSLLFIGGCYLLATLSPLIFPAWRTMDARRGLAQSESDHGTDLKDSAVTTRAHPIPETTG